LNFISYQNSKQGQLLKRLTTDILGQVNANIYLDEDNKKLLCELDLLKAQINMYLKQNKGHLT